MGGLGSGSYWHDSSNATVSNYVSIDIRKWCREGLLTPGNVFSTKWLRDNETIGSILVLVANKRIILFYRYKTSDVWTDANYPIIIESSPCNFGGRRQWFRCPAAQCGSRVAVLYGGAIFACRKCFRLAYPSQRENIGERAIRKAEKVRDRLGWVSGILNGEGSKPKGMHWRTFTRLRSLQNELTDIIVKEACSLF